MDPVTIYGLVDPRFPDDIRYVGKTAGPVQSRLLRHISASKEMRNRKDKWIRDLLSQGIRPHAKVLEIVEDDWESSERGWISKARESAGGDLLNIMPGGQTGRVPIVSLRNPYLAYILRSRLRTLTESKIRSFKRPVGVIPAGCKSREDDPTIVIIPMDSWRPLRDACWRWMSSRYSR